MGETTSELWQPRCPQRASRSPVAEYAQCLICWSGRGGNSRPPRMCCCLHGLCLSCRPGRAVPCAEGDGRDTKNWYGRDPVEPWAWHHQGGNRRRGRATGGHIAGARDCAPALACSLSRKPGDTLKQATSDNDDADPNVETHYGQEDGIGRWDRNTACDCIAYGEP